MSGKHYLRAAVSVFLLAFSREAAAQDLVPLQRRHEAGPLAADEFKGTPPKNTRFWAYTETETRYNFRYFVRQQGRAHRAELTEIDVYAIFLPDKSWLTGRTHPDLMQHEQGHFDIAQTESLRIKLELLSDIQAGSPLTGLGRTAALAVDDLQKKVHEAVNVASSRIHDLNAAYDRSTLHGTDPAPQSEARKKQLEELRALMKEVSEVENAN